MYDCLLLLSERRTSGKLVGRSPNFDPFIQCADHKSCQVIPFRTKSIHYYTTLYTYNVDLYNKLKRVYFAHAVYDKIFLFCSEHGHEPCVQHQPDPAGGGQVPVQARHEAEQRQRGMPG